MRLSIVSCLALLAPSSLAMAGTSYIQTNLTSDGVVSTPNTDPNLQNAWGMDYQPGGPFWVASNGLGKTTIYDGTGATVLAPITIPPAVAGNTGNPTGVVYNGTGDFQVGGIPAPFIYVSEDGAVTAWNGGPSNLVAHVTANAVYKGVSMGSTASGNFLYAANFHAGAIDVFDKTYTPASLSGNFTDPTLPSGYAPFNVRNIGGKVYVTYAQQDADAHDEIAGAGKGFLDVFDTNGTFQQRLVSGGKLDAPWGIEVAPASFGTFGGALLVGNFGDGKINAYDKTTGNFLGTLQDKNGKDISIDGLWAIENGNGGQGGGVNELFFAAGPDEESHGLFGKLTVGPPITSAIPLPSAILAAPGMLFLARRMMRKQKSI